MFTRGNVMYILYLLTRLILEKNGIILFHLFCRRPNVLEGEIREKISPILNLFNTRDGNVMTDLREIIPSTLGMLA